MASLFARPLMRPQTLGLGLGLSLFSAYHVYHQTPIRLESRSLTGDTSYRTGVSLPGLQKGVPLRSKTVRQISSGSIIGLCAGLLVGTFSRPLVLLLGLLITGVQWAQSYGITVIPYKKLQKHVSGIDLRSLVEENAAFKISFGTTFAMAAFMHF